MSEANGQLKFKFHSPCVRVYTYERERKVQVTTKYPLGKPAPYSWGKWVRPLKTSQAHNSQSLDWIKPALHKWILIITLVTLFILFMWTFKKFKSVIQNINYHLSPGRGHPTMEPCACSSATPNLAEGLAIPSFTITSNSISPLSRGNDLYHWWHVTGYLSGA